MTEGTPRRVGRSPSHPADNVRSMTHRCCQRIPDSSTLSWIRPHVCRLNHNHTGPHQCTCMHEWPNTERQAA